ncbi:MAG: hypothetical protein JSV21_09920 [Nitrospirota bacterium]|nr:MAG: hypothetical protein JSV21_09920 [Nitrospirota bacterium]
MRYTSVLVMLFRTTVPVKLVLGVLLIVLGVSVDAEVIDEIIANVDDIAITRSELLEEHRRMREGGSRISLQDVLNGMINRVVLLKDASRYRMEGNDDEILEQYIEIRIRALIRVDDKQVREYYNHNIREFKGSEIREVYSSIRSYLIEVEVNKTLSNHIEELKRESRIKVIKELPLDSS